MKYSVWNQSLFLYDMHFPPVVEFDSWMQWAKIPGTDLVIHEVLCFLITQLHSNWALFYSRKPGRTKKQVSLRAQNVCFLSSGWKTKWHLITKWQLHCSREEDFPPFEGAIHRKQARTDESYIHHIWTLKHSEANSHKKNLQGVGHSVWISILRIEFILICV